MAKTRLELQAELEEILGSRNVYFNPPPTIKMKYPAIVYHFSNVEKDKANNGAYLIHKFYSVTLIHRDPDNDVVDKLLERNYEMVSQPYTAEGLYHYAFETYL